MDRFAPGMSSPGWRRALAEETALADRDGRAGKGCKPGLAEKNQVH